MAAFFMGLTSLNNTQVTILYPAIHCDVCNRHTFRPPGIWETGRPPESLTLSLREGETGYGPYPVYDLRSIDAHALAALAEGTGWVWYSVKIEGERGVWACPKCRALMDRLREVDLAGGQIWGKAGGTAG